MFVRQLACGLELEFLSENSFSHTYRNPKAHFLKRENICTFAEGNDHFGK